ncbi:hypothetical protein CJ030_MR2G025505 [Morella rubra]|uniref:Uncharacterized protein n=1 Tax=Morella rubra TaxID=262757 RepID=A0A6A1WER1_9ROSI|nr:hypothetical protein CJ030_MR2G025505 [Morella rubra]
MESLVRREGKDNEEKKETIGNEKYKDEENDHYKGECSEDQECDNNDDTEDDGSDRENEEDELNEDGDGKDDEAGDEEGAGDSFGKVFKPGSISKVYVRPELGDGGRAKRSRADHDSKHPAGG